MTQAFEANHQQIITTEAGHGFAPPNACGSAAISVFARRSGGAPEGAIGPVVHRAAPVLRLHSWAQRGPARGRPSRSPPGGGGPEGRVPQSDDQLRSSRIQLSRQSLQVTLPPSPPERCCFRRSGSAPCSGWGAQAAADLQVCLADPTPLAGVEAGRVQAVGDPAVSAAMAKRDKDLVSKPLPRRAIVTGLRQGDPAPRIDEAHVSSPLLEQISRPSAVPEDLRLVVYDQGLASGVRRSSRPGSHQATWKPDG
jgi:hypothetical protein